MGISGDMGLRRAVIIIFIIALLPLSILEVKADSNIGYQELVEVEVNSADTVEMENARYNRPDSISVISGDSVGALFQDSVPVMITDSLGGLVPSDSLGMKAASRKSWRPSDFNPDPMRAVWLSALFPGLGQIYNHRYWKLPIVVGGYVGLFMPRHGTAVCCLIINEPIWILWTVIRVRTVIWIFFVVVSRGRYRQGVVNQCIEAEERLL